MSSQSEIGSLIVKLQAENAQYMQAFAESQKAANDLAASVKSSMDQMSKNVQGIYDHMEKKAKEAETRTKKRTTRLQKAFKEMATIAGGFIQAQLLMKLAAMPGEIVRGIKEATLAYDKIDLRLRFIMGNAAAAAKEFKALDEITGTYGVNLKASAQFYTQFLAATEATNISLKQSQDLFLGTTQAAVALQMSTYQTEASFRAFQQMASKGRVAAEELRGQLGEAMPGALGLAARAMDMPIEKLSKIMEQGKLLAEDLLPAFGQELQDTFSGPAMAAADNYLAALNRIENQWFIMLAGFGKGSEGIIKPLLDRVGEILKGINEINAVARKDVAFLGYEGALRMAAEDLLHVKRSFEGEGLFKFLGSDPTQHDRYKEMYEDLQNVASNVDISNLFDMVETIEERRRLGTTQGKEAEDLIYKVIQEQYSVQLKGYDLLKDRLDVSRSLTQEEVSAYESIAKTHGLQSRMLPMLDKHQEKWAQINQFNNDIVSSVEEINAALEEQAAFDAMSQFEQIDYLTTKIAETEKSISDLRTDDFGKLRQNREELDVLLKQLERMLKLRQSIAEQPAEADNFVTDFVSPTLDTESLNIVPRTELDNLQDHWETIHEEYLKHRNKINKTAFRTEEEKQQELTKLNNQWRVAEQQHQRAVMSATLLTQSQMFADLATITAGFAGEQSGVYKTMFAVSKAFAIADGALKLNMAIMNAMASGPFPWNLGAMASVAAAGANLMTQITSATASFEGGGYTGNGPRSGGIDGRGGFPAILHPKEVVTDLTRSRGSMGGPMLNVIVNNLPGQEAETRMSSDGKTAEITIKQAYDKVANDIRRGQGAVEDSLKVRDKRMGVSRK